MQKLFTEYELKYIRNRKGGRRLNWDVNPGVWAKRLQVRGKRFDIFSREENVWMQKEGRYKPISNRHIT